MRYLPQQYRIALLPQSHEYFIFTYCLSLIRIGLPQLYMYLHKKRSSKISVLTYRSCFLDAAYKIEAMGKFGLYLAKLSNFFGLTGFLILTCCFTSGRNDGFNFARGCVGRCLNPNLTGKHNSHKTCVDEMKTITVYSLN